MDKTFDKKINKIKGLYYLPWIGNNFINSETKLLVLGESNYDYKGAEETKEKEWNRILIKQNYLTPVSSVYPVSSVRRIEN